MKIRTALSLTGLMLIAGSVFAADPQRTPPGDDSGIGPRDAVEHVSRALKVPVILDGVQFPAGYDLPDNVLTFVLEKGVVYAFSSLTVAQEFMRQSTQKRAPAINSISCVKAACVPEYTVLYSCRYFQMTYSSNCQDPARLYIAGGDIYSDLNNYGFNNRTSSIRFE